MNDEKFIYEYDEDSELLESTFKKKYFDIEKKEKNLNTKKNKHKQYFSLLEVGFGSGILLEKIFLEEEYKNIKNIFGTEINFYAYKKFKEKILYTKKSLNSKKKIILKHTSFNEGIKEKFDFILFNPPYLPESKEDKFLSIEEKNSFIGGKKGVETTIKFLKNIKKNLKEDTLIFFIASSHSDLKFLEHNIKYEGYTILEKEEKKLPFEKLYCYVLKPNLALKYSIKNKYIIEYYDKGKRSIVYLTKKNSSKKDLKVEEEKIVKYALKEKNTNLKKEKEILNFLKTNFLGKKILVPKVYEYIEEDEEKILILQYIKGFSAKEIDDLYLVDSKKAKKLKKNLYKKLLEYAIILDLLKLKKQEFTRPYSNVLISKNKIFLIDFERTQKNKIGNLNQLLDYFRKNNLIKVNVIKILVKDYEKELKSLKEDFEKKMFLKKWYLKVIKSLKF